MSSCFGTVVYDFDQLVFFLMPVYVSVFSKTVLKTAHSDTDDVIGIS